MAPQFLLGFGQPVVMKLDVFLVIAPWRESQNQGRDIRRTGQVQPAVAHPPPQGIPVNGKAPLVIDLFRYPADAGRSPDIEPELLEDILFRRIFDGIPIRFPDAVDLYGMAQGRVRLVPVRFIRPVFLMSSFIRRAIRAMSIVVSSYLMLFLSLPAVVMMKKRGCSLASPEPLVRTS